MKRNVILLLALISSVVCSNAFCQALNLVNNGSFETLAGYPSGQGELYRAAGWSNCNGFTGWPYGSPDLFHTSGTGGMQLPTSMAGSVNPLAGNAVTGFIAHNGYVSNFREYLSCHFESPLEIGETYSVEFYLTNGFANWYGRRGSNGLGAAFTMTQPTQLVHEPLALTPQIEIVSVVHHTDWRKYSFLFSPTQAFEYMTIGNFRNDAATSLANFTSGQDFAYYFLDLVSVSKVALLPAEALQLQQVEHEDALELTWRLPSNAEGDGIILERSIDQQQFEAVHDFGPVDNAGADVFYTDAAALPGITYYYRLRDVTRNGDVQYSGMVEAKFGTAELFVAGEVYPNPVQERFALHFAALEETDLTLDVYDAAGRLVMHEVRTMQVGHDDPEYLLPQGLAAGIYQAKFNCGNKSFTKKLMVTSMM